MAIKLRSNATNNEADSKTRRIGEPTISSSGWHDAATRKLDDAPNDDTTRKLDGTTQTAAATQPTAQPASNKTMVYRGNASDTKSAEQPDELPVGWLVVVDGPGRGTTRQIGFGQNAIGRNADQRIQLDLGDQMISRERHAVVTYDPKGKIFYLSHGQGDNLTYLDSAPVLEPKQLNPRDKIVLGDTTLLFVPLCDDTFDW